LRSRTHKFEKSKARLETGEKESKKRGSIRKLKLIEKIWRNGSIFNRRNGRKRWANTKGRSIHYSLIKEKGPTAGSVLRK